MNAQEYISSGIIESCVLGLASAEEQLELENMCSRFPEVQLAKTDFELRMEQQAMNNAIAPPADLKRQLLNALPSSAKASVIAINASAEKRTGWLKYAVAACALLLAGSLYWNMSQYNRNKRLQASYNAIARDYDSTAYRLSELEDEVNMISLNPNIRMAAMKGMDISPASFATVYWDTTSTDVYLLVHNLPRPATDKQYQLWAMLNGKPIDLGMIDNDSFSGEKKLLLQMKNVSGAQAFAITLEKKGGNPSPQGPMYTMGKL